MSENWLVLGVRKNAVFLVFKMSTLHRVHNKILEKWLNRGRLFLQRVKEKSIYKLITVTISFNDTNYKNK